MNPPLKNPPYTFIDVSDEEFREAVLDSPLPVALEFWSPNCSFCVKMEKVIRALAKEKAGSLVVARMNVLENAIVPASFSVGGIPAFFLLVKGEVKGKAIGAMSKGRLKRELGITE